MQVRKGQLVITEQGTTLVKRKLTQPGMDCYKLSPYVVSLWFDLATRVLAIQTFGDKCMIPDVDWSFLRLPPSPPKT